MQTRETFEPHMKKCIQLYQELTTNEKLLLLYYLDLG
jgi:hypothetical protein